MGAAQQRRAMHAAANRAAMVQAARELFAEQGYFATTIEQIARRADVSPATVYAVAGGKAGLVESLVQLWAEAPILADSARRLPLLSDPQEVLDLVATASRKVREQYGDVMRVLRATAAHETTVAAGLHSSTIRYRQAMEQIADHLARLSALPPQMQRQEAVDILWFYFGYSGYFTLIDDNGWDLNRAQTWLRNQCALALGLS
ncbi:TetR/AcrR family transcriptional regulator [Micromonosporaceae bacterium Da 78-11]